MSGGKSLMEAWAAACDEVKRFEIKPLMIAGKPYYVRFVHPRTGRDVIVSPFRKRLLTASHRSRSVR